MPPGESATAAIPRSILPLAMSRHPFFAVLFALLAAVLLPHPFPTLAGALPSPPAGGFAPWKSRNGHVRPLIAVVGHNAGTELTDFVIPYAALQRSGAADLFSVSVMPGPMTMLPALRLRPDTDIDGFDAWFPEGADYIVVPAMAVQRDERLLGWLRAQYDKGATLVSICDGALVVAGTGLLDGHRATAHWATASHRREAWPATDWVANTRYVVDGRLASSAGISASIPASLALIESIAGHAKAVEVGAAYGITEWTPHHDSDAFRIRPGTLWPLARVFVLNRWLHRRERMEIPLRPGMDDLSLALAADAWSRTGRGQAHGVAAAPEVQGGSGLLWFAEPAVAPGRARRLEVRPAPAGVPVFDDVLASIQHRYGRSTARGVAIDFEYPWGRARP